MKEYSPNTQRRSWAVNMCVAPMGLRVYADHAAAIRKFQERISALEEEGKQ